MTLFGKITKANRWWGSALRGKHSATATTRADQRKPEQHINLSYHGDVSMQLYSSKLSLLGRYSRGIKSNPSKFTDVDKAMKRLFDEKPFNRKAIKHFIETRLEVMNVSNMINFLHIASRKRYLVEDATLGRLHNRIQSFEFQLKDHHIGKAFYAFRTLNSSPNALQLVKIYSRFLERSHDLSQLTLANAFYTLQLLQSESQLHRELFDNLSRIIRNNPPLTLSNSNVCAILSGIRNVRDRDQQSLLEALLPLFEKATGELNSSELADMLDGICSMRNLPQGLLSCLSKKIKELTVSIKNRQLCKYLVAIRQIHSHNHFIFPPGNLTHLILLLSEPMDAHNFTMIMSIFQSFTSQQNETHQLLTQLTLHLGRKGEKFDQKCYINGLAGLRYMSSSIPEVETFLNALYQRQLSENTSADYSPRDISFMLYGLQTMSDGSLSVNQWVDYLTAQLVSTSSLDYDLPSLTRIVTGIRLMKSTNRQVCTILHFVENKLEPHLSLNQTSFVQFASALQGKSTDHQEVCSFIKKFVQRIYSSPFEKISDSNQICQIISGLGEMNSHDPVCRHFITAILSKCSEFPSHTRVDVHNVATVAYAIRSLDSRYSEVTSLLELLSLHLAITTSDNMKYGRFHNIDFLNSLIGLRRLNSDQPAVKKWLSVIVPLLEKSQSNSHFKPNQICSAMASLSHLANDEELVRRIIFLLREQLSKASGNLSTFSFAEAVFGLRRMYEFEDRDELTDKLLLELLAKIDQTSENFSERSFVRICSQLSFLNTSSSKPFQILVNLLAQKFRTSSTPLSTHGMSIILRGLRGLSSNRGSTRGLVDSLIPKVSTCEVFTREEFCLAFSGMEHLNSSHECVRRLFDILLEKCPSDLWENLTPSEALLLTAGMSSLNPFEFESANRILIPLSEQRQKFLGLILSPDKELAMSCKSAVEAINIMMSRKGIEEYQFEPQMKILKNIETFLILRR